MPEVAHHISRLIPSLFILASFTLPGKALAGDYAPHPDNLVAQVVLAKDETYPAPETAPAPEPAPATEPAPDSVS